MIKIKNSLRKPFSLFLLPLFFGLLVSLATAKQSNVSYSHVASNDAPIVSKRNYLPYTFTEGMNLKMPSYKNHINSEKRGGNKSFVPYMNHHSGKGITPTGHFYQTTKPGKSKQYLRIQKRSLQEEGNIDLSFLLNTPMDEWNVEQFLIFIVLVLVVLIMACCFCCCCFAKAIAGCCCGHRGGGYRGNYHGNGYYSRGGGYGDGGSTCLQNLICMWCCWEICCTDDILDTGGYQEAVW